jgi:hypothetical protein
LHSRFWHALDQMAIAHTLAAGFAAIADNTLPDMPDWAAQMTERDQRIARMSKLTDLSVKELEQVISGDVPPALAVRLLAWQAAYGGANAAGLIGGPRKPLAHIVPHWQAALDAKFEAVTCTHSLVKQIDDITEMFSESIDLNNKAEVQRMVKMAEWRANIRSLAAEEDYRALLHSEVYSFNGETAAAIREAAASIPVESPLSAIETPNTGAGWYWFADPLPVASAPISSDRTHALLWSWVTDAPGFEGKPALAFSAYVRTEKAGTYKTGPATMIHAHNNEMTLKSAPDLNKHVTPTGKLYPAGRWHWLFEMSFHDMLAYNRAQYREVYGPGGRLEGDSNALGETPHLEVVAALSLFFIQSCLWMRQTVPGQPKKKLNPILTQEAGHIERHARKRYQREHKLNAPPTVRVVALRKTARVEVADAPVERHAGARAYGCRFVVKGHPRLQAVGPGRKERKLIWIESFVKGPEDKPLKTRTTVYAVVR